jgi:N-acetylglucosamine kinase-like BadF-type ATPase
MTSCFLGIDVGGSKTMALIVDESGNILGSGRAGAGNHEVVGYAGLAAALQASTDLAMEQASIDRTQISGAGFGVAGYDWPSELPDTLQAIETLGLSCPVKVVNDTVIGLVAGAEAGWGVAVISGSGCNCWGRDRTGREGRVTGNGGMFGEGAGAGEIMGRVLQAVAYDHFLRGPRTRLTSMLIEACGAKHPADLIEGLALEWYHLDASWAPKVFQIASEGDPVAQGVIQWAGRELGELACCVIRQLEIQQQCFEVVLVGSVFAGGRMLIEPLEQTVRHTAPNARFTRLTTPPVAGAVLLGIEAAGLDPAPLRKKLIKGLESQLTP